MAGFAMPVHTLFHLITDKLMAFLVHFRSLWVTLTGVIYALGPPQGISCGLGNLHRSSLSNLHPTLQTGSWSLINMKHAKAPLRFCFHRITWRQILMSL